LSGCSEKIADRVQIMPIFWQKQGLLAKKSVTLDWSAAFLQPVRLKSDRLLLVNVPKQLWSSALA